MLKEREEGDEDEITQHEWLIICADFNRESKKLQEKWDTLKGMHAVVGAIN